MGTGWDQVSSSLDARESVFECSEWGDDSVEG
ncbi:MAG: hypothetical protein CM1200mP35_07020 [Chloroflexota bacterium]|nr:MAG: hypothetical protein CM1200mP35_07020 [Chloroflexota bacterium]